MLLSSISRRTSSEPSTAVTVRLSMMEIYNETMFDLLSPPPLQSLPWP